MNWPISFFGLTTGILLVLGFGAGCGKQTPPDSAAAKQDSERSPKAAAKPALQAELDTLNQIKLEPDPAKRPLLASQRASTRRDWALTALRSGYFETGRTNRQWNAPALEALEAYADYSRDLKADRYDSITNAVTRAKLAGCDDPMLQYMHVRYCLGEHNNTDEKYAIGLVKVCRVLAASHYHPAFKFTAALRAMVASREADSKGSRGALQALANVALQDFARDTNAPAAEVFQAAFEWQGYARAKGWTDFVMHDLQPILEANWANQPDFFALQGAAEVQRAWDARGSSWANTVSEKGWEGFGEHLQKAEEFLTKAWQMAPTNPLTSYHLMQVELGQGRGRSRMEQWFRQTMALSTNNADAVKLMSFYLEPRWYGSEQESLEFARTCVTNKNWGGNVPLVLPNVHHSLAKFYKKDEAPEYWQRPEVWSDIRSAYERFFELNPADVSWRHDYAKDAYLCGQYQAFMAQTRLFSTGTNYAFFGGKPKFEAMLRQAAAASQKAAR